MYIVTMLMILLHIILDLNNEKNSLSVHRYVQQQRGFSRDTKAVVFFIDLFSMDLISL